jgi:uncharacterized membrane protein required for colicin V production
VNWNWLDWLIVVILAGGVIDGFRQGIVRLVIGFGAMIVGLSPPHG